MSLYDLLTREERQRRRPLSVWHPENARYRASRAVAARRGDLRSYVSGSGALSIYEAVILGLSSPIANNGRRIPWTCPDCQLAFGEVEGWTVAVRCKPCEQQRCAARTTANLTDAVQLLRRHGRRIRMLTLTLPSRTVLNRDARRVRSELFEEAKALLAKARRTSEWKKRVQGYLWNFECPVRFHECISGLMASPNAPQNRALVPVTLNPHFHILLDGEYWPQSDISDWAVRSGFGPVADIRQIRSARGARYALKRAVQYAAKEPSYGRPTRQTGGTIRQASRLSRWLWKNRAGSVPETDARFSKED